MRFVTRSILTAVAALVGSPLGAAVHAQSTPVALDVSKIAASRDSFVVMVQGQPMGYQVVTTEKTADGLKLSSEQSIMNGMVASKGEVLVGKDNAMRSIKSSGSMQGMATSADIAFENGRAKGKASVPGMGGIEEKTIDAAIPAGVADQSLLTSIIPTIALAQGSKYTLPLFATTKGETVNAEIEVTGSESVTVPAGTFDSWVVSLTGVGNGMTLYVAKSPARIVRIAPVGQPVELQLAK